MTHRVAGNRSWPTHWVGTAWAVPVMVAVPLVLASAADDRMEKAFAAVLVEVVLSVLALVVSLVLHLRWRITRSPSIAWVTVVLAAAALERLTLAVTSLVFTEEVASRRGWVLLVEVAFVALLVALLVHRHDRPPRANPLLVGLGLGLAVGALRLPTLLADPLLPGLAAPLAATSALLLPLCVTLTLSMLHLGLPIPWPHAVPAALVLLGVSGAASVPVLGGHRLDPAVPWGDVAVALLLGGTAIALLHTTITESTHTVAGLRQHVDEVEAGVAADRERLHEINATVAGIATASRLMHDHPDLAPSHIDRLDELLTVEIERLERLAVGRESSLADVPVDETVGRLVLAHRAMGRDVHWRPSGGLAVRAHGDDLAEIMTTLLNNAAEHAPGSPVEIGTRRAGDAVEITVADRGPGVDGELAERIFESGVRVPTSRGQGIGLYVARRLTERLGGGLCVVPAPRRGRRGAVFVLTLPTAGSLRGASTPPT